ncbi:MAG: hypothetical protein GF317_01455 [Candidatus Lokiarchaeota archaeon]|nr:hypothetical protein [Candidatus Lokiarchaeota archaeon]MBD3198610.1 hypothetical protein [Candidatus Lokiarchaeota archaeon]
MIFDYENKVIQVKIVFYGPAMSGKTTSMKFLFNYFNKSENMHSIESSMGRTLFFDFGVLEFKGSVWDLKLLVYSATGQDFYASTRPATLRGVDGIIFVMDSQKEHLQRNVQSWRELKLFFGENFHDMPIVATLNKYDKENISKITQSDILSKLNHKTSKPLNFIKTEAINGKGILETFQLLIQLIFPELILEKTI